MALNSNLVQVGTAAGTPVYADVTQLGAATSIELLSAYALSEPPGLPRRPQFTGTAMAEGWQTLADGTVVSVLAFEAVALIAAGFAMLAGESVDADSAAITADAVATSDF